MVQNTEVNWTIMVSKDILMSEQSAVLGFEFYLGRSCEI